MFVRTVDCSSEDQVCKWDHQVKPYEYNNYYAD